MARSGEEIHEQGRDGVRLAKNFLESTGRADVAWDNPTVGIHHLKFTKASGEADPNAQGSGYSFDCGGFLQGEGVDGMTFLAEVKNYTTVGTQAQEYLEFLAKCYRTIALSAGHADKFLWITWHPFSQTNWSRLLSWEYMRDSIMGSESSRAIALAEAQIDEQLCESVANRIIVIVLSNRQLEVLTLSRQERIWMKSALMERRAS